MAFPRKLIILVILLMRVGADSTKCDIPAIYNFGDSNSDTGGIAAAFYPEIAPYGDTYFHRPSGRASDGRLIIDFIAEHLGLPHLSAYLDSIGTSFVHGANFATGGATIRRQNESWFEHGVSPFSLDIQVEHYDQFKARTTYVYNNAKQPWDKNNLPKPEEFANAIYIFDIGQNDLAAAFRMMTKEEIKTNIPDIVKQFSSAVQQLYEKGARSFWIHNTGPIGCLPISTVNITDPGYLDKNGCLKYNNDFAVEFNKQLKDRVIQLRKVLPQATLTHVDMYAAKYQLISNAKNQGFEDPFTICCGIHDKDSSVWCGQKGKTNGTDVFGVSRGDPSKVISWDGVHYSEAANHWIANHIVNGSFSDPPIPITHACHSYI